MNQSNENDTDALREDIDQTRRRMDDTMDRLGERLEPRHLVDEFFGYLRGEGDNGENRYQQLREKVTRSASQAMSSVVETVKQNPMPAVLIGAGVAWMIYESTRDKSPRAPDGDYYGYDREGDQLPYDPDVYYDRPLAYPAGSPPSDGGSMLGEAKDKLAEKASSAAETVKDKLSDAGDAVREKAGELRDRASDKFQAVKERAGEMTDRVKDSTRRAYRKTRERVVTTADQHPLEVGLVALAAGLIVGLALPTPTVVNRRIGPTADKLRERTRRAGSEMLEKGRHVAEAAVHAAKDEAKAQGLTPEKLRGTVNAALETASETSCPVPSSSTASNETKPAGSASA